MFLHHHSSLAPPAYNHMARCQLPLRLFPLSIPIPTCIALFALFAQNASGYSGHLKICQTSNPCVLSSRYAIESQEISDVAAVSGVLEVLEVQPSPSVDHQTGIILSMLSCACL